MRRALVVIGIVLLLLGVVAAVVPMVVPSSFTIPQYPSALTQSPNLVGSGTLNVRWSGANAQTVVTIYQCGSSGCDTLVSQLGNGTGASGSISVPVSGGGLYAITEDGSSVPVAATASIVGITTLVLIGIVLALIGVVLAVVGWRTTARPRAAPTPYRVDRVKPAPGAGTSSSAPSPDPSDSHIMEAAESPAALSGTRPTLICNHCGAPNEPWLTNCRKCKRPLASTGTS
jgi:uncharacterized membrane protein